MLRHAYQDQVYQVLAQALGRRPVGVMCECHRFLEYNESMPDLTLNWTQLDWYEVPSLRWNSQLIRYLIFFGSGHVSLIKSYINEQGSHTECQNDGKAPKTGQQILSVRVAAIYGRLRQVQLAGT
jgi:hypothetical protein